jgi:hypothetical protein
LKLHELDNWRMVDTIRVLIGLEPLYLSKGRQPLNCKSYVTLEALRKLATPDCSTCSGFGYYDGEQLDMRCACTGREQRKQVPTRTPAAPDRAFAYRGRRFPPKAHL